MAVARLGEMQNRGTTMSLRRWNVIGALLAAAVIAGCEKSPEEKVQDEREDVVQDQQKLREDRAELSRTEREAQEQKATQGTQSPTEGGPLLPPLPEPESAPAEGSQATSPPPDGPDARLVDAPTPVERFPVGREPADAPNEGAPEAGTPAAGTGDRPAGGPRLTPPPSGPDGQ
jgi:hypothetical protein